MNPLRILLLTCLPILTLSSPAFGSIIVSFGTSSPDPLIAGSSGTIDVFAEASSETEILDGFQLGVSLSGGPAGGLLFSSTQTEGQLAVGGATGYVFFGDSLAQDTATPIGTVSGGGTTYTGFDAVFSSVPGGPSPITLTQTPQLLYRLNLDSVTAGTYTIEALVSPVSSFFSDQYNPLGTDISFTSTPGSITVEAAAAVPEPGSLLFCGFVAVYAGARRWRTQRTSQRSCV